MLIHVLAMMAKGRIFANHRDWVQGNVKDGQLLNHVGLHSKMRDRSKFSQETVEKSVLMTIKAHCGGGNSLSLRCRE
jgi:hypothetical protein